MCPFLTSEFKDHFVGGPTRIELPGDGAKRVRGFDEYPPHRLVDAVAEKAVSQVLLNLALKPLGERADRISGSPTTLAPTSRSELPS